MDVGVYSSRLTYIYIYVCGTCMYNSMWKHVALVGRLQTEYAVEATTTEKTNGSHHQGVRVRITTLPALLALCANAR